jgi:hypothetical protein
MLYVICAIVAYCVTFWCKHYLWEWRVVGSICLSKKGKCSHSFLVTSL